MHSYILISVHDEPFQETNRQAFGSISLHRDSLLQIQFGRVNVYIALTTFVFFTQVVRNMNKKDERINNEYKDEATCLREP